MAQSRKERGDALYARLQAVERKQGLSPSGHTLLLIGIVAQAVGGVEELARQILVNADLGKHGTFPDGYYRNVVQDVLNIQDDVRDPRLDLRYSHFVHPFL